MGTGKTLTSIAITGVAYKMGYIKKILVVAPTSVVSVWPDELRKFADFEFTCGVMLGEKKKRLKVLSDLERYRYEALKVAVINYESVWRDEIFEAIQNFDPDMIIADESQRIKSPDAKQSVAMHVLGDKARYKLILSGTPIQKDATDIWSQYRFLDNTIFGDLYNPFKYHYCQMGGFNNKQVIGIRKEYKDDLIQKEYSVAFRVTKEEALDLPEQTFETRYIRMTPKERSMYDALRRDSVAELDSGKEVTAMTVLVRLLRLQQFTGGFLVADDEDKPRQVSTAKLDALKDIIEDYVIDGDKKLVVFARFVAEVEAIVKMAESVLSKERLKTAVIYGKVKKEDRGEIVHRFQTDPDTVLFIGQIDTAGTGITLTAADTCVYYSKTFNYGAHEQSLSRIHRIGQKNACTYIDLVVENSVDDRITQALKRKEDLAAKIVDNWREVFS